MDLKLTRKWTGSDPETIQNAYFIQLKLKQTEISLIWSGNGPEVNRKIVYLGFFVHNIKNQS